MNGTYHQQLELERIATTVGLTRLATNEGHDPVKAQTRQQMQRKLQQIETAMNRLQEGEFGICQACHNPINPERLVAMPYVELCIQCQRGLERKTIGSHRYHLHLTESKT